MVTDTPIEAGAPAPAPIPAPAPSSDPSPIADQKPEPARDAAQLPVGPAPREEETVPAKKGGPYRRNERKRKHAADLARGETRPKRPRTDTDGREVPAWGVRNPKPSPFSAEEIAAEERRPKKKVAVLLGYSGTGYRGLQINNDEKTIERDVMQAFIAAGAISKANAGDPKKVGLVRCARTDKGVHAAGNVLSLKLIVEDEDIVDKINEHLPPQIRVWDLVRTSRGFSCYSLCDSRWYEYLLPSYTLLPPHPDSFLGKKVAEFAEEKGVGAELREKNADVEGFWEEVERNEIQPILDRLDPETRAAVVARRTKSEVDVPDGGLVDGSVENEAEERARKSRSASPPAPAPALEPAAKEQDPTEPPTQPQPEPVADAPSNGAPAASDETAKPDDAAQSNGFATRELTAVDFAIRDIKLAYIAAKRRYRVSPSRLARLQAALDMYVGTNNFHNYTVQKAHKDPSAKRLIKSFVANPEPIIIGETEWLSLKVHGQSFMMHQIRKMVGLATLVTRCATDPAIIPQSYGAAKIAIPKAPALGLLLERPDFGVYNAKMEGAPDRDSVDFERYKEKIEPFKREFIYSRIFEHEEREHTFHNFYQQIDHFKSDYFLWITAGGIAAAKQRMGVVVDERALDRQLGNDEDSDANPEEGEG